VKANEEPGHNSFTLLMWKKAVELIEVNGFRISVGYKGVLALANALGCTEKTAQLIMEDYKVLSKKGTVKLKQE
jgi:hypothetical protein